MTATVPSMDLRMIIERVTVTQQQTLASADDEVRAMLDDVADTVLHPVRDWLTDLDIALTDAEESAQALADADSSARPRAHGLFQDALAVLLCELVQLTNDAAAAAHLAAIPDPCRPPSADLAPLST